MQRFNRLFIKLFVVLVIGSIGWFVLAKYSFVFSKSVKGKALRVERLVDPSVVVGGDMKTNQVFSFAIAVRDEKSGEIFTSSTEDRQWAVVESGQCVVATFYPYPPWDFAKNGTYFNARLDRMYDCDFKPTEAN